MNPAPDGRGSDDDSRIVQVVRIMQIIAVALLFGMLSFLGIVLFLRFSGNPAPAPSLPIVSLVSLAMLLTTTPVAFVLPGVLTRNGVRQIAAQQNPDPGQLLGLRQTTFILGLALMEGTGFTALVAMLLEFHPIAIAVLAVAFVLMVVQFPTVARVRSWLERQQAMLEELALSGTGPE